MSVFKQMSMFYFHISKVKALFTMLTSNCRHWREEWSVQMRERERESEREIERDNGEKVREWR
jgi:hypothetical protein